MTYRSGNKYSVLKLRMGTSESSCQSTRVPKNCGRRPKFGSEREVRSSPHNSARSPRRVWTLLACQKIQKANDFPGRTDGPLTLATHTAMSDPGAPRGRQSRPQPPQHRERASLQPPAGERTCPMSSIRNLSWPSQRRLQKSEKSVRRLN
jgi:hypothetical protein